jgi:hypothetical protein
MMIAGRRQECDLETKEATIHVDESESPSLGDKHIGNGKFVKNESDTQRKINRENRDFLRSTDWYVIRYIETGIPVPSQITTERAAARAAIIE